MNPPGDSTITREAVERPDLLDAASPPGLRVFQITADRTVPSSHVYPEAHVFTPDSRRFVFKRAVGIHRGDPRARPWRHMLCDTADGFAFRQISDETLPDGAILQAPSVAPDGSCVYYVVDEAACVGQRRVLLKRVWLDSFRRETLVTIDTPLPGYAAVPSRIYGLSSISRDGKRLCASGFLGDWNTENAPWGLIVFDLEKMKAEVVLAGEEYCNMHPQYCWSPEASHDIMVQHNHGSHTEKDGRVRILVSGAGADVHVVRDDGSDLRDMPWGRDEVEFCQGHQCWRGHGMSAVSSMVVMPDEAKPVIEAFPCSPTGGGHQGKNTPGAFRSDISRDTDAVGFYAHSDQQISGVPTQSQRVLGEASPQFCHFAFIPAGTKFISDLYIKGNLRSGGLVTGTLDADPGSPLTLRPLLCPRSSWSRGQQSHPHPFFSPDGARAFFNSDESGVPQIYAVEGL